MVRLLASHPDFKKFDFMQNMLLVATNPQMFFDIEVDIPEDERLATVELIKGIIEVEMNDYQFLPSNIAEVVNELERKMKEADDEMSNV